MRRSYEVCKGCRQSWIWHDRLIAKPDLKCTHCQTPWQSSKFPDLRRRRRVTRAAWNFPKGGAQWPQKTYQNALLEAPPGLHGGQAGRKQKKAKQTALCKAVQEHWDTLPEALRTQCEALGVPPVAPPPRQDLPALIKEHLQSLPQDLKAAVEKIVKPEKPEPTLAAKLSCEWELFDNSQIQRPPFRPN